MFSNHYDVFISYRRDGGEEAARLIRNSLKERGYRVFLDTESLRSGQFDKELYRVIEEAKDVVVILPPNGLDRCSNEGDWLRLEIEHAVACKKNIVPVFLKDFEFPADLPPTLEFLRTQQGIEPAMKFYDAFIDQLRKMLLSKPFWSILRAALILLAVVVITALICAAVIQRSSKVDPETKPPAATAAAEAQSGFTAELYVDSVPGTHKNKASINPYGLCICQYQILHDKAETVNIKVVVDILDNQGVVQRNEIEFPNHETAKWDTVDVDMFEPDLFDGGTITFRFFVKETDALIGSISAQLSSDATYYARTVNDGTVLTFTEPDSDSVTTQKVQTETILLIENVSDGKAYFHQNGKSGYVSIHDIEPAKR